MNIMRYRQNNVGEQNGFPVLLALRYTMLCCFLFHLSVTFAFHTTAPPDSIKKNYALNDPRNPDCPCHKYQKIADDEYKAMQQKADPGEAVSTVPGNKEKEGTIPALFGNGEKNNDSPPEAGRNSNIGRRKHHDAISMNKQHRGKHFYKMKGTWSRKFSKRFHSKKDPSSCFHWT